MGNAFGAEKPLKEVVRENQRMIKKAVRELEREINDLNDEKRLLKLQLDKSYRRGKPAPRKKKYWKKKPVKK